MRVHKLLVMALPHQHTKALVQESLGTHSSTLIAPHTHTHTHTNTYCDTLTHISSGVVAVSVRVSSTSGVHTLTVHCVCVCVWCYECTTVGAQGFLYKCLGVLMRKSHHKQFVNSHLEMMFATIRHSSQAEREVHLPSSLSFSSFFLNLFFPTGLCYRCRFLCCVSSWSCCGETGDYF